MRLPASSSRRVAARLWSRVRARLQARRAAVIVRPHGLHRPNGGRRTFVAVCGPGFDQRVPNAATLCRMGWCNGFEQLGFAYRLVGVHELAAVLPALPDPLCWISADDHAALDDLSLRCLARHRHAVLVNPGFTGDRTWFQDRGYPDLSTPPALLRRVLAQQPRFLFTLAAESGFEFYAHWRASGLPLVSLPLACDASVYVQGASAEVAPVPMAFVGGYWRYKARQLDPYLLPHAQALHVWGYQPWPYGTWGGRLPLAHEGPLYRQAAVSPVINEPHASAMGIDLNERVFKVLGAGGLAVTDASPAYRDWFGADELLVPGSRQEFHAVVREVMSGSGAFEAWRTRGTQAVLARHTYEARARAFCRAMGEPVEAGTRTA